MASGSASAELRLKLARHGYSETQQAELLEAFNQAEREALNLETAAEAIEAAELAWEYACLHADTHDRTGCTHCLHEAWRGLGRRLAFSYRIVDLLREERRRKK